MKRKHKAAPAQQGMTLGLGLTAGQELDTALHARALAEINQLADTLGEFGVSQGDGRELPASVLFLPSLQRIQEFVLMHRHAVEKLAVEKMISGG